MVAVPVPEVLAKPELSTTATLRLLELQLEDVVTTSVVPSLKLAVAVNC